MIGHQFHHYIPESDKRTPFEKLLPLFVELLNYTNGDPKEALDWMEEINKDEVICGKITVVEKEMAKEKAAH
jgi:Ca-activated chloride channel homolog